MTGSDSPGVRYHSLDATRSTAMMIGLFFHGALSFTETPIGWAVQDRSSHLAVDVLVWFSHTFRMPVFFVMSGFFARMLYERRGAGGLLAHRTKRVLVPFVAAFIPNLVSLYVLWEWGGNTTPPEVHGPDVPGLNEDPVLLAGHLWFLYYLILTYALMAPFLFIRRSLGSLDRPFRAVAGSIFLPFVMAFPTAFTLSFMVSFDVETPFDMIPQLHVLGFYLVFFGFGWLLHRQPALLERFGRLTWLNLALGFVAAVPLMIILEQSLLTPDLETPVRLAGLYLSALVTWSLGICFIGLFVRFLSHPRPWVRWLSDSSYWSYILHLPVAVCFQILLANLPWPGVLKYALVMAATMGICLVSYRYLVRYTFIGAMLNGRKVRGADGPT